MKDWCYPDEKTFFWLKFLSASSKESMKKFGEELLNFNCRVTNVSRKLDNLTYFPLHLLECRGVSKQDSNKHKGSGFCDSI